MKQTKKDQEIIEELRTLTGYSLSEVTELFEYFALYALTAYSEGEKVSIPFFGDFHLKFDGDEVTDYGREAKVTGFFSPHAYLKKTIGEYEDVKGSGELYNIDIIQRLKKRSKHILDTKLNEE